MSIKFYIPNWNNELTECQRPKRASRRFRALIPLKGMRPEDGIQHDTDVFVDGMESGGWR